ncbi:MAG: GNAT family N-acetyltransferase [Phycisphaerales bacterium JB063]
MSNQPTPPADTPEGLCVRSYAQQDQSAVARLYDAGLLAGQIAPNDSGADLDYIQEAYFDDPRHHFWVAEHESEILGMIGVASDEEHTAEIRRLRVDSKYQGTGIAAVLLETAIAHCKHHSYLKIRLDTRFEKDAAVDLFERVGFQHTRTRPSPGKETLEFYLDLYRKEDDEDPAHAGASI